MSEQTPSSQSFSQESDPHLDNVHKCVGEGDKTDLFYIPTGEQIADIFTKNPSPVKFKDIRQGLPMISYSP